ncbi:hypothetical protein [Paraburkholderia sediminicola]|uniref:hypothetical protein n=1 Tax=Paraburkholderia sediminicola TaxID=458836 RepID=UPI0038BA51FE
MENLTLTEQQFNLLKKSFTTTVVMLAGVVALFNIRFFDTPVTMTSLFRWFTTGLTAASFLFVIFYKWAWRIGPLPAWSGRPLLQGVWVGFLSSDYGQAPDAPPLTLPIVFVIRQTYLTLSLQSFTQSQTGDSRVEAIIRNARNNATRLAYVFELKNEYPGARKLVNGADDLELLAGGTILKGSYWTSSPTHGSLAMRRVSTRADEIKRYEDAAQKWPLDTLWHVK